MSTATTFKKAVAFAAAGVALGVAALVFGASQPWAAPSANASDVDGTAAYQAWKSAYPDQYGSFATHYYDHVDGDEESHFHLDRKSVV